LDYLFFEYFHLMGFNQITRDENGINRDPPHPMAPSGPHHPLHSPPARREMRGYCEPMLALDAGKVGQFERIGFERIEKVTPRNIEAYWGHR